MPRKPRGEATPEEREYLRQQNKRHRVLRDLGKAAMCSEEETKRARDHLVRLSQRGMSSYDMAEQTPFHQTTINAILHGYRTGPDGQSELKRIRRTTYDEVMKIRYETSPDRQGSFIDDTGTVRRLQALVADGYSYNLIAEHVRSSSGNSPIWKLTNQMYESRKVSSRMAFQVRQAYRKLCSTTPQDMGLSKIAIGRAKAGARRNGFIPSIHWDDDTIDNPDAFPEWTGACGTPQGYRIHRREGISMCTPCQTAMQEHRKEKGH